MFSVVGVVLIAWSMVSVCPVVVPATTVTAPPLVAIPLKLPRFAGAVPSVLTVPIFSALASV